jgi:glycosyltransferase involved in cell wall biosynthesis
MIFDNNSQDNTQAEVISFMNLYPQFECAIKTNPQNFGYVGNTFQAIQYFRTTEADFLIVIDGDNQFPVKNSPLFLRELFEGSDLVLTHRENHTFGITRKIGSYVFRLFCAIYLGSHGSDINGGMRALSREFAMSLEGLHKGRVANPALFHFARKNAFRISWVPIKVEERKAGKSFINWDQPFKLLFESLTELSRIRKKKYEWYFHE